MMEDLDRVAKVAKINRLSNPNDHRRSMSPPSKTTLDSGSYSSDEIGGTGRYKFKTRNKKDRRGRSRKRDNLDEIDWKRRRNT